MEEFKKFIDDLYNEILDENFDEYGDFFKRGWARYSRSYKSRGGYVGTNNT